MYEGLLALSTLKLVVFGWGTWELAWAGRFAARRRIVTMKLCSHSVIIEMQSGMSLSPTLVLLVF